MLQEHLEKLISTGYKLVALETDSPQQSINDFRPLVREGKAIYLWEEASGLRRMEASHIEIPNTKTPEQVLKHIINSKHYGVYVLVGLGKELREALQPQLKSFIADQKNKKKIIFVDSHFQYPYNLMGDIVIAQETAVKEREMMNQTA